jgi:hypothetical protein
MSEDSKLSQIDWNITNILEQYLFVENDVKSRHEVKTLISKYLNSIKSSNDINEYFINIDAINNTIEVIHEHKMIIDIGIKLTKDANKFSTNRITIFKTGT